MPRRGAPGRKRPSGSRPPTLIKVSGRPRHAHGRHANGWLDKQAVVLESLLCFKRAGTDAAY
nr:hypothetical protein [endosymbiont of Lamellibrachia barhami]